MGRTSGGTCGHTVSLGKEMEPVQLYTELWAVAKNWMTSNEHECKNGEKDI